MDFFKSKEQRKADRDMEVRKGLQAIRRNIRSLEKDLKDYRTKAVRAKQISATEQLNVIRDAIRRSMAQIRLQERQMLAIETAMQMKNQAETMVQFASSMTAVSTSIGDAFNQVDMDVTLGKYEQAMTQAQDMEERMNVFLDMSSDVMSMNGEADDLVSMDEIDHLIDEDLQLAESGRLDEKINAALRTTIQE